MNVAGIVPTVSSSVEVKATLNAAFSLTDWAASVVTTGALSLNFWIQHLIIGIVMIQLVP